MSTSANKPRLSHPVVIGGVIVLLAAVTVLNIRTFGSKKPRRRPVAAATNGAARDYPTLPTDLNQVLARSAAAGMTATPDRWGESPRIRRDPFRSPDVPVVTGSPESSPTVRVTAGDSLVCEAVMLGGRRPVAVIGGRAMAVQEEIRGHRLVRIGPDGAWLSDAAGREIFLPVGGGQVSKKAYRMVNGVPSRTDLGSTTLESRDESERRRP